VHRTVIEKQVIENKIFCDLYFFFELVIPEPEATGLVHPDILSFEERLISD
jgi:hypothetical protein